MTALIALTISIVSFQQAQRTNVDRQVEQALKLANENRTTLETFLEQSPKEQKAGAQFLIANMPYRDLQKIKLELLQENSRYAYKAWNQSNWKSKISEDVFSQYILPYACFSEERDMWRKDFYEKCSPIVEKAKTPTEAAVLLNQQISGLFNVRYSKARVKAVQSPLESIKTGTASCTGLSILLVDACRSVGIPARIVGTPQWSDRSGNHTWVEIWDDGWHYTGACEPTGDQLNRGWFSGKVKTAQEDHQYHAIYAVSFKKTKLIYPIFSRRVIVYGENVTARYLED